MQVDHDEAFLPFVGIIIAELTSATVVILAIVTIAALCSKYRISEEQFDKATYCIANGKQGFYIVESQSEPGVEYHVTWNEQYKALACTQIFGDKERR